MLVNPNGNLAGYISEEVPSKVMELLMQDSQHPIFELELLPATWRHLVHHCQCVFYLDNEEAKGALIHAATSTPAGQSILEKL